MLAVIKRKSMDEWNFLEVKIKSLASVNKRSVLLARNDQARTPNLDFAT
jgi:hypothetical protein